MLLLISYPGLVIVVCLLDLLLVELALVGVFHWITSVQHG